MPLGQIETLKANPNLLIETHGYDYQPIVYRLEFNLANPYFAKPEVRRAVAHAVDRDAINRIVFYGWTQSAPAAISPALKQFHNPGIPRYEFAPKKAEALLDAAGLPRGPDGTRFKVFHDYMPYGETYQQLGAYTRQALSTIGIGVTLRAQDVPTWFKRTYTNRDFDFMSNGMSHSFDPTVGVQRLYWSKNFKPGVPFSNGSHYANPEVDRLLETAATELDPKKRYDHFVAFQRILAEDLPDFGILSSGEFTIFSRSIDGHTIGADGVSGNLADVHFVK